MLTDEQIREAIAQCKVQCEILMPNYEPVSLRSAMYTLGYDSEDADQVIRYCADRGFNYCIDPIIPLPNYLPSLGSEYPSSDVCWWGPDQLKSRLQCVR